MAAPARTEPELDLAVLDEVQRRVLWLATSIVHHANRVRPNRSGVKVGTGGAPVGAASWTREGVPTNGLEVQRGR